MIRKIIIVVLTLAAVATGVLWCSIAFAPVRSVDPLRGDLSLLSLRVGHHGTLRVIINAGAACFFYHAPVPTSGPEHLESYAGGDDKSGWRVSLPVAYIYAGTRWKDGLVYGANISLWVFVILFAAWPAIALIRGPVRRYRIRRLERKGLCPKCGYDLTGNVSGVCPECGQQVPRSRGP